MVSKVLVLLLVMAAVQPSAAHNPITTKLTWSRDISRILYKRCASCHHPGGNAPMSLLTYVEARPWAKAIQEEVLERRMPPWGAVKGFGEFEDDSGLTQEEIHLLADWVEGGAPEGDPKYLPDRPRFPTLKRNQDPSGITVNGQLRLDAPLVLRSITPRRIREGASVRVVARMPDTRIEPLLWIYNFKPKFTRAYVYRDAVRLPAGATVEVLGAGPAAVLLSAAPSPAP